MNDLPANHYLKRSVTRRRLLSTAALGWFGSILIALLLLPTLSWGSTIDNSHVIGNHKDDNGTTKITLNPDPVQLLADPSTEFMNAMTNSKAADDWWGDTIDTFNWTGSLNGTFVIDVYNAKHSTLTSGGAEILLHYDRGDGDPVASDLFWIQVVDSSFKNGGETIPYPDVYFSSYPAGGKLPFYFRPDETVLDPNPYVGQKPIRSSSYTVGGTEYDYDLAFWDFPKREADAYWTGELFLATYDDVNDFVKVYDGVKWGFTIVPEPPTIVLLILPVVFLLWNRQMREIRV